MFQPKYSFFYQNIKYELFNTIVMVTFLVSGIHKIAHLIQHSKISQ